MYRILHQGVDTLDIAFQGAFPHATLEKLEAAAEEARSANRQQPFALGPKAVPVLVAPNGMSGGFRYVFSTGPTGAIFAVKANANLEEWNLFVSIRALRLLTLGYADTKAWLHQILADMGFIITGLSVNRIDFAVDILAPDFKLDIANFVTPGQAKARPYWSKEQLLNNDGHQPKAVIRGREFESVTIGTMPNRQLIVYDKRRAAIDLRQPYWFEVWGIDKDDPGARVWRVEMRAGRDALAKLMMKRSYEAVEHHLTSYLVKAAMDIRLVIDKGTQKNVTRTEIHPLWRTLVAALCELPTNPKPPMPEARALEIIRGQKQDMALKQGFGNLLNYFALEGVAPVELVSNFDHHISRAATAYEHKTGGHLMQKKAEETVDRLTFLMP